MSEKPNDGGRLNETQVATPEPFKTALDPADDVDEPTHTKEPWQAVLGGPLYVEDSDGYGILVILDNWVPKTNKANAARIVACVNACAGMADPERAIKVMKDLYFGVSALRQEWDIAAKELDLEEHDRQLAERVRDACLDVVGGTAWPTEALEQLDLDAILKGETDG